MKKKKEQKQVLLERLQNFRFKKLLTVTLLESVKVYWSTRQYNCPLNKLVSGNWRRKKFSPAHFIVAM